MSWVALGTILPDLEWRAVGGPDSILIDYDTVLIRVTHSFTLPPRGSALLRQFFIDQNGYYGTQRLYPTREKRILRMSVPAELKINGVARWEPQIRLGRFKKVPSASSWTITLEAGLPPDIPPQQQPTAPFLANQLPNGLDDIP
jgi:hypothetical protein